MKLPTIEQVQAAHTVTANDGLDNFGKSLNKLQTWGRQADKIKRRGNLTAEEDEIICWIKNGMSKLQFDAMPNDEENYENDTTLTFEQWFKMADMPTKTKEGWVDLETGVPFAGTMDTTIEPIRVDIYVATGDVD